MASVFGSDHRERYAPSRPRPFRLVSVTHDFNPTKARLLRYHRHMNKGFFQRILAAFSREPKLHPVDRKMARHWIKRRLLVVFPELRNNPTELERAYQDLGMEVQPGKEEGDAEAVFVLNIPEQS
jgi:hypothetical protein